jgi:hypothetical protein
MEGSCNLRVKKKRPEADANCACIPRATFLLGKIEAVASATTRARIGLCSPGFIFLSSFVSPFILEISPLGCYYAMALFPKRLTCHGCGHRSPQPVRGSVGKFHCNHCDADTYLDQVRLPTRNKSPSEALT